jgi:hypothetical protein
MKPAAAKREAEPSAPMAAAPVAAEPVTAVATVASSESAPAKSPASEPSPEFFYSATWSMKPLDLWSENTVAFLDFAEQLGKAKNLEDVMNVQSRFTSERYESFVRQSKDFMEFAQSFATVAAGPFGGVRAA